MANTTSAEKANRQRIRRQARNSARKAAMRTAIKKVRASLSDKKSTDAGEKLKAAVRLIDNAGGKGLLKRNTASRLVSRLTTAVARAKA